MNDSIVYRAILDFHDESSRLCPNRHTRQTLLTLWAIPATIDRWLRVLVPVELGLCLL